MSLITTPNFRSADSVYAALLTAHKGLGEDESHALNARLVLILMNHIGDDTVLADAMDLARKA